MPSLFQIRDDHVAAFQSRMVVDFENRAIEHLREHLTEVTAGLSDDHLRRRVRACIPRAANYDLVTEQQVIAFVDTSFLAGENFDSDPNHEWAKEVLTDPDLDADDKAWTLIWGAPQPPEPDDIGSEKVN